jgi:hypothetical protein
VEVCLKVSALVCRYRRHGHNELDQPMFTQPLFYNKIKAHPTAVSLYKRRLVDEGVLTQKEVDDIQVSHVPAFSLSLHLYFYQSLSPSLSISLSIYLAPPPSLSLSPSACVREVECCDSAPMRRRHRCRDVDSVGVAVSRRTS